MNEARGVDDAVNDVPAGPTASCVAPLRLKMFTHFEFAVENAKPFAVTYGAGILNTLSLKFSVFGARSETACPSKTPVNEVMTSLLSVVRVPRAKSGDSPDPTKAQSQTPACAEAADKTKKTLAHIRNLIFDSTIVSLSKKIKSSTHQLAPARY